MKVLLGICSMAIFVLMACKSENEEDVFAVDCEETISLTTDVLPIIQADCAVPGCHVAGGQSPNFEVRANIINRADRIRERTSNGTMPPSSSGRSLTGSEIEAIRCWVAQGALDN